MSEDVLSTLKIELGLIPEEDFAALRKIDLPALRNERSKGEGPPWTRLGKAVFYPVAGLRKFAEAQTVTPSKKPSTLVDGRSSKRCAAP
jgi:hypothetical protein